MLLQSGEEDSTVELTKSSEGDTKQSQDTTDFIGDLPNEDEGLTFSLPPVISSTPPATEEQVSIFVKYFLH